MKKHPHPPPAGPPRVRLIKKSTTPREPEEAAHSDDRVRLPLSPEENTAPPRHQSRTAPPPRPPREHARPHPRREYPRYRDESEPIRRQHLGARDRSCPRPHPRRFWKGRPKTKKPPSGRHPRPIRLTPEQRAQVEEMYRSMVTRGERPPEGRRKKIAATLGVPYELVQDVVRNYLQHERLRHTNFDIEKIYWRELRQGQDDARAIAETAAAELKVEVGRVWWWLQKLHEWRKSLHSDPDVSDEQRAQIIAEYNAYLQQSQPPETGLHKFLADKIGGITPRQVHKTLLEYRLNFWNNLKNIPRAGPEDVPRAGLGVLK